MIGRNEAPRLGAALDSCLASSVVVVYVDSASSDESVDLARERGVPVLELPADADLSAARARNAGFEWLVELRTPDLVQFLDGDSTLAPGWLETAAGALRDDPRLAIACGRLRESSPETSLYRRVLDDEWDQPSGEITECAGIFMVRSAAFLESGGFDPSLRAGEEPELCWRLTRLGWRIVRLETPMATHDSGIDRFAPWWRREVRSGFGFAQVVRIAPRESSGRYRRELWRARLWVAAALAVAAAALGLWVLFGVSAGLTALGAGAFGALLQCARIAIRRSRARPWKTAVASGVLNMIAKLPQLVGQIRYARARQKAQGRV